MAHSHDPAQFISSSLYLLQFHAEPMSFPLTSGLQTQLLVEVTGLVSRQKPADGQPQFSHVVLRRVPEGTHLGQVSLEPVGPPQRGLLAASLPPTLLSVSAPFSLELVGQDGVGQGLRRTAPQPCSVAPVLLEVRRRVGRAGEVRTSCSDLPFPAAQWPPRFPDSRQQGPSQPPHRQLLWPPGS